MSGDGTKSIWWNGALVPHGDAKVHVLTHAIHYGTGVFEGIRAYKGPEGLAIFRLEEHIDRLFQSASAYKIEMAHTRDAVIQGCIDVVRDNDLDECYLRPIAFIGFGPLGVYWKDNPTNTAVAAFPWGTYLGPEALEKGIRVTVSSWTRIHHAQFPTTAKGCGQYLNSVLAVREAHEKGFDEALLLDRHGNVAEGSGENLFLVNDGSLRTPGLDSSILPGITRESVMELARDAGLRVEVGPITRGEVYTADEAFFTGTAAEVTPIREVDGHVIGSGGRGPITEQLQSGYLSAVRGGNAAKDHWLTRV